MIHRESANFPPLITSVMAPFTSSIALGMLSDIFVALLEQQIIRPRLCSWAATFAITQAFLDHLAISLSLIASPLIHVM